MTQPVGEAVPVFQQRRQRDLTLRSVVRLVKERTPEDEICHGVTFHLDPASIHRIRIAQARGQRLSIPRPFLVALLRYVLVASDGQLQSAISFITFYPLKAASEEAMLKTLISMDGDIIQQVCERCLGDETLALHLSTAHYWLIHQLLGRLTFEITAWINRVAWGVSGGVTAIYVLRDLPGLIQGNAAMWGRELAIATLLPWVLKTLLQRTFQFFIPLIRQIALRKIIQPAPPANPTLWHRWIAWIQS